MIWKIFLFEVFCLLFVVFSFLVYLFGNTFVNILEQQMVLLLIVQLFVEMDFFYYVV